jgi:hypothetical protein
MPVNVLVGTVTARGTIGCWPCALEAAAGSAMVALVADELVDIVAFIVVGVLAVA